MNLARSLALALQLAVVPLALAQEEEPAIATPKSAAADAPAEQGPRKPAMRKAITAKDREEAIKAEELRKAAEEAARKKADEDAKAKAEAEARRGREEAAAKQQPVPQVTSGPKEEEHRTPAKAKREEGDKKRPVKRPVAAHPPARP